MVFVTLLLFAELALSVTAGYLSLLGEIPARLGMAAAFTLPLLFLLRAPEGTPRLTFRPRGGTAPLLLLLPHFILATAAVSGLATLVAGLFGITLGGATPLSQPPASILFDAALPAVCEELFCRGALFSVLRPMGRRTAVIGSAILFALLHASVAQIPYALVAGLILALLYESSGSLLYPMLFHLANNLFSLLLFFCGHTALFMGILGGAALLATVLLLPLARRIPLPAREEPPRGALRELLLSPIWLWIAIILTLTVL